MHRSLPRYNRTFQLPKCAHMISDTEIQSLLKNDPDNGRSLPMLVRRCQTERGGVIPFVGAGLSCAFGFPLWGEFLLGACGNTPGLKQRIQARIAAKQYEEAASDLAEELGPFFFQDEIARTFGDSVIGGRTITGSVAQLTRFPVAQLITTNFDRVIETAFSQRDIPLKPILGSKIEYGVEALQQGKPFLLKLHGDWEDCDNRVLTLEDYEKAYGNGAPEATDSLRPLPELLTLLLKTRCFLFLGCSLENDGTMKVLSELSKRLPNRTYHFAIVERPNDEAVATRKKQLEALSIIPIWFPSGSYRLIETILQYVVSKMEEAFPPVRSNVVIPKTPTPIVGRQADIQNVVQKLKAERLVTILGPGGVAKPASAKKSAGRRRQTFRTVFGSSHLQDST
jgi:hypothetical protein